MIDSPSHPENPSPTSSPDPAVSELSPVYNGYSVPLHDHYADIKVTREIVVGEYEIAGKRYKDVMLAVLKCDADQWVKIKIESRQISDSTDDKAVLCDLEFSLDKERMAFVDMLVWCQQSIPALQATAARLNETSPILTPPTRQPCSDTERSHDVPTLHPGISS